jgi:hypothetical protein
LPTISTVASSPYARLRATLAQQADYPDFVRAYFIQDGTSSDIRSVYVTVTAAHLATAVGTWTVEVPDLTGAGGYPTNAGLRNGATTDWFVEAFSGSFAAYIGGTPVDGATVRFAGRSSTTQTMQLSATGDRVSPRARPPRRPFAK